MASTPDPETESRSIAHPATTNGVWSAANGVGVSMLITGLPGGRTVTIAPAEASNATFGMLWAYTAT
jgi:hypothetical protein